MSKNTAKSKPIIKELDYFIETALPESSQLSFAKEITFKLIPAIAIAFFAVYLIIFDRHFNDLSLNPVYSFVYILGLFLYGVYLINANQLYKTVLKQIYVICIFSGGMYLILTTKEYWSLPMDIYSSYLYMFSLFAVVLADTFYLIDYAYSTPRYSGKLFENKDFQNSSIQSDLVTKLDKFSQA